jgi:hypothetical protein
MSIITKKDDYEMKSKSFLDRNKNEVDDINERFEYVGHINDVNKYYREFVVIKCLETDEHYLNISTGSIKEKYLIKIDIDDENKLKNIVSRYDTNKRLASLGEGIGFIEIQRMRMELERNFSLPKIVNDEQPGWHHIIRGVGKYDNLDQVAQIENGLIFNQHLHSIFIEQMTAFYATERRTIIETAHSDSLLVFIFNEQKSSLFVVFYFQGETSNDIPVDVQACMDMYGLYEVST